MYLFNKNHSRKNNDLGFIKQVYKKFTFCRILQKDIVNI